MYVFGNNGSDDARGVAISAEMNSGFCYSNSGFLNDRIPNNWSIYSSREQ